MAVSPLAFLAWGLVLAVFVTILVYYELRIRSRPTPKNESHPAPPDGTFKTDDGHWTKSKAEAIIDNWLHKHWRQLGPHEYDQKIPGYLRNFDFYLPSHDIYIEFWGLTGDARYEQTKKEKLAFYAKQKLKLIELYPDHIQQLNYHLSRKLRDFGIKV